LPERWRACARPERWRACARALVGGLLLAILAGGAALAHKTNLTKGVVTIDGAMVGYRLTVSAHDLAVALGIETDLTAPVPQAAFEAREAALADYLAAGLALSAQGARCTAAAPAVDYGRLPEDVVLTLRFACPAPPGRLRIDYRLFFEIDPVHRSIGSVTAPDGTVEEFLFDRSLTHFEAALGAAPAAPWHERFVKLLLLGVEHILLGFDHLLFLLALLIVGGGFARLVGVVTAFTIAHSLTLALAWFGVIALPERLVETLIALSIALVALQNLLGENLPGWGARRRWLVAGGFGLIHGLGFYSALSELSLGGTDLVTTLLAFNLGVEAGQIAVVALVYVPLAWWLRQSWYATTARAASLAILLVAGWWTLERAAQL
jgi:hypothetical protein